ncbi:hypothetical protein J5N97_028729 [Dioscorea zingiberensis]|uniref:WRC domain-containing protein n=1 Tax=Dioscorea zingiberensis TaxID=325984 RepID=A0A9D5BZ02_9LILI|nr:hypothetical protein J5N97_028729 [Dioscorea zingiberensis]
MRIRRNASRILGLASCLPWLTSPEPRANDPSPPLGELCQLNRSPWDVSPSPSEEARDPDPPFLKVEDSIRQDDSVVLSVPMSEEEEKKGKKRRKNAKKVTVETMPEKSEEEMTIASAMKKCRKSCNKSDGKGWRCKKPAQVPHSLCRYHLAQLRAYNAAYRAPATGAAARGRKRRTTTRNTGSDFYYYSGFGPWRGKKRSGDNVEVAKKENAEEEEEEHDDEDVYDNDNDIDDDDNDEDDDDGEEVEVGVGSRKRGRKKIKARSLKSLL